jgi:hypothetical protein
VLGAASPIAVALLVPQSRLPALIPQLHAAWIEVGVLA